MGVCVDVLVRVGARVWVIVGVRSVRHRLPVTGNIKLLLMLIVYASVCMQLSST